MKNVAFISRERVAGLRQSFWRSFTVMGSFHPSGMQRLGMAATLYPILSKLHGRGRMAEALTRYSVPYNCHPYFAGLFLGLFARAEDAVAANASEGGRVARTRQALSGPLAAIGDSFFWATLKPLSTLVGLATAWSAGPAWGVLAFLAAYTVPHVWFRVQAYRRAIVQGDSILGWLKSIRLAQMVGPLKLATASGLAALLILGLYRPLASLDPAAGLAQGQALALGLGGVVGAAAALINSPRIGVTTFAYLSLALAVAWGLVTGSGGAA